MRKPNTGSHPSRTTQRAELLRLFLEAKGSWVPLPDLLALGIAQYSARVCELRKQGFNIQNRIERQPDGSRHSWFRLLPEDTKFNPALKLGPTEQLAWEKRPRVTGLPLWDALK